MAWDAGSLPVPSGVWRHVRPAGCDMCPGCPNGSQSAEIGRLGDVTWQWRPGWRPKALDGCEVVRHEWDAGLEVAVPVYEHVPVLWSSLAPAESNTSTEPDDSHSETIARIDASYEWTSPGRWTPVCRPPARPSAVFDEARMRADLVRWFGPAGAHVDLWDTVMNRLRELEA
jgi:hypothetical protein